MSDSSFKWEGPESGYSKEDFMYELDIDLYLLITKNDAGKWVFCDAWELGTFWWDEEPAFDTFEEAKKACIEFYASKLENDAKRLRES